MDVAARRRLSLGALFIGIILLGWDVFYAVTYVTGGGPSSDLPALFGAGAIPSVVLIGLGLALQLQLKRA